MSALDKTIPPLALNLINKFGTTCVLSVNTGEAVYDTATAKMVGGIPVQQTVKGLVEEYADNLRFLGNKLGVGSSIVDGDKKVSVAAQGLTNIPNATDTITVGGITYVITGVGTMWSGELAAVYVLHVSKR